MLIFAIGAAAASPVVSLPWFFDTASGDSLVDLPFQGGGFARLSLDTGSATLGVTVPGCETVDPAQSMQPLVAPPVLVHDTAPNSTIRMHYGSGSWTGAMASGALALPASPAAGTPLVFAAMLTILPGGFPVGGAHNIAGILGLTWPNPAGARERPYSVNPFCVNGSKPTTASGRLDCDPPSGAVPNVPLLQQLLEQGVVGRSTLLMSFEGSVANRTRQGTLLLGAAPPTGAAASQLLPLVEYMGLAFAGFYLVAVNELAVGGNRLPFDAAALVGNPTKGGFVVDTGEFGLQLPPAVLAAVVRELHDSYSGPATLDGARMDALLASANISELGPIPPFFGPPPPCVNLSAPERAGFAALQLSLGGGVELPFPPDHFIYPARDDWPDCMMLAFHPGEGIIGSFAMHGRSLFLDQDNHSIAFLDLPKNSTLGGQRAGA